MRTRTARIIHVLTAAGVTMAIAAATPALAAASGWLVSPHPQPANTDASNFSAVFTASHTQAWAVGSQRATGTVNPTPLIEHWNGSRWAIASGFPGAGNPADVLNDVSGTGPDEMWAVGETISSSGISHGLIEHFNGQSWTTVPSPAIRNGSLAAVSADSPADAWAAGSIFGRTPLIEHWNGTSWQVVKAVPSACTGCLFNEFRSADAISPTNVWVLGFARPAGCEHCSFSFMEHWNGSHWTLIAQRIAGAVEAISSTSAHDVWAVGSGGLIEHFNGATWTQVVNPAGTSADLGAIDALSPADAWAVSRDGMLIEQWNGTSWRTVPTAPNLPAGFSLGSGPDSAGLALSGITGGPLFAVGGNFGGGNNQSTILEQPRP